MAEEANQAGQTTTGAGDERVGVILTNTLATGEGFYGAAAQDPTEYEQSTYAWYEAGYHQGLAEYDAAVQHHAAMAAYGAGQSGYEAAYAPEIEAAYYQGMADYEALLAQQTYR